MKKKDKNTDKKESKTGKYVYDKKLGKVVKVSDQISGLKKGNLGVLGCPGCGGNCSCG